MFPLAQENALTRPRAMQRGSGRGGTIVCKADFRSSIRVDVSPTRGPNGDPGSAFFRSDMGKLNLSSKKAFLLSLIHI